MQRGNTWAYYLFHRWPFARKMLGLSLFFSVCERVTALAIPPYRKTGPCTKLDHVSREPASEKGVL